MKNFAISGVAGYIAPRHLQAISAVGGRVVAALDVSDSVGILDSYNTQTAFFTEQDQFEQFIKNQKGTDQEIHCLSICSPNSFHFEQINLGLSLGLDVICEKPLVFTEKELDELAAAEKKYNQKVNVILQLRLHEKIVKLKSEYKNHAPIDISLDYITTRGPWYLKSWKGKDDLSGGLATNIGVHFFDMLTWVWGSNNKLEITEKTDKKVRGILHLQNAQVSWFLSIDSQDLPKEATDQSLRTFRSIVIDQKQLEFSSGFTELHNESYKRIVAGEGFGLEDIREATRIVEAIRLS